MPKTPKGLSEPCPHEIRPGTTVCLHCRHAERLAARVRRKHYMLRSSVVGSIVATLGAAGVLGAMVIRGRSTHAAQPSSATAETPRAEGPRVTAAQSAPPTHDEAAVQRTPAATSSLSSGNVVAAPQMTKSISRALVAPIVPEGRFDLPDGISAMRTDSVVMLNFDTKLARTRIPEKFERFVRATLPVIYGAAADSALSRIPQGGLAQQGDLINELPMRGMRIPVPNGGTIALYPITRPGQDGPLVTRYRVVVIKG